MTGSKASRKLDISLSNSHVAGSGGKHDWTDVLVIGEHKQNLDEDRGTETLVQLAGYAREVYGSQPDRRFVPGFTICGSLMRLWMFDRSGCYSSEKFDIHREPERFVTVMAGYALMTDAELGLNTYIHHDENGKHILARGVRILLEDKPIATQKAIVCRGTTCFRGRSSESTDWTCVVKLAWPSDKRQREGELMRLAKERGVQGVAEWFHDEPIEVDGSPDTIAHFRKGMRFEGPRKLAGKASWVQGSTEPSRTNSRPQSRRPPRSVTRHFLGRRTHTRSTTISSSERKRKRDEGVDGESGEKRFESRDSQTDFANTSIAPDTGKRIPGTTTRRSIQEDAPDSLAGLESETYGNRIHCCLVVSPAGRPLHAYRSVKELLTALHDAVKAHRSLLEDGRILHRDISENNIIITEAATEGDPTGMLIDLDLAKELDSLPSGASHRTGTMQFMAIEVLQGKGHTYRHDLESFFYVFVWMCIRYDHEERGDSSVPLVLQASGRRTRVISASLLQGWYSGTYTQVARNKLGNMDTNGFESILSEFCPSFDGQKALARQLRQVLFPIHDGALFTGTFRNSSVMYDEFIQVFSRAIDDLN